MRFNILNEGDKVLNISNGYVLVERKNKEIDLIPIHEENGQIFIDKKNIITIGFGDNTVETTAENGVKIIHF